MNEKKQAIFESLPVKKAVLLQAMPAVASQMVTLIYNLADTYFVGLLNDPNQTAAITVAFPSFLLLTCGSGAQFLGYLKILVGIGVPFGGLESGYITGAYWLSLAEALLFALPVLRPVRRLLFPAAGRREANAAASPSTLLLRTLALLLTAAILFYSIILML